MTDAEMWSVRLCREDGTEIMRNWVQVPVDQKLMTVNAHAITRALGEGWRNWRFEIIPWQSVEQIAEFVRKLSPEYEAVADAILQGFVESKPERGDGLGGKPYEYG